MAQATTDATFATDVTDAKLPVLVDFWGPNCGPCETLSPMIDRIAELAEGYAKVFKVNVQENPNLAAEFGIRGIPTVIVFHNGVEKERFTGVVHPKNYLDALGLELDSDS